MGKEKPEEIEERVRSYLGLSHRLVGIKISEESLDGNPSIALRTGPSTSSGHCHPAATMTFCRVVREALRGKGFVIGIDDLSLYFAPSQLNREQSLPSYGA